MGVELKVTLNFMAIGCSTIHLDNKGAFKVCGNWVPTGKN